MKLAGRGWLRSAMPRSGWPCRCTWLSLFFFSRSLLSLTGDEGSAITFAEGTLGKQWLGGAEEVPRLVGETKQVALVWALQTKLQRGQLDGETVVRVARNKSPWGRIQSLWPGIGPEVPRLCLSGKSGACSSSA